jgi:hypothetical protein
MIIYNIDFINNYRNEILKETKNTTVENENNAWKPSKSLTIEASLQKELMSLLNKITEINYNIIFNKIKDLKIPSEHFLKNVCVKLFFDKIINDNEFIDIYHIIIQNLDKEWDYFNISLSQLMREKIFNELINQNIIKNKKKNILIFLSRYNLEIDFKFILNTLLNIESVNKYTSSLNIIEDKLELFLVFIENYKHIKNIKQDILVFINKLINNKQFSNRINCLLTNYLELLQNSDKIYNNKNVYKLTNINKKKSLNKNNSVNNKYNENNTKKQITDYFMSFDEKIFKNINWPSNNNEQNKLLEYSFQIVIEENINYNVYFKLLNSFINKQISKSRVYSFLLNNKQNVEINFSNYIKNFNNLIMLLK